MTTNLSSSPSTSEPGLLPQYGFGSTYTFDVLVEHHHFLFRVHTPKRRGTGALSRPSSPPPPSSSSRPASPFAPSTPSRPALSRSPSSSLSASVASLRTTSEGASDYFAFAPHDGEDDTAPGDPYFLSRRFKDELASPDAGTRRRTLSTLSTLSGGSGMSYIGSDDGSDAESDFSFSPGRRGNLSRSASMVLGPSHTRSRTGSLTSSHPGAKRSQSASTRPLPSVSSHAQQDSSSSTTGGAEMTYTDLVQHLDWTTRAHSPYVTTSFSFFYCLWEAVRRYKLGVKHDVEIAVIDARKVRGRARTALEVLRGVEGDKQDKAYWKWYRFALESQDVLVFGAIPGDAIYASIPLTQIMPKLPSYFFVDDVPRPVADPREPDAAVDPRSPTAQMQNPLLFPSTPGRPATPTRERERERVFTGHLLTTLAWDVGTTLKPQRKSSKSHSIQSPGKSAPRHTSHAEFCKALSAAFAKRSEADKMRDATTGAVSLAELLVEPWFRARCAEGGAAYPFRHGDDSSDEEVNAEVDKMSVSESVCLGLAGDGCALEHSHASDSSIQDALFGADEEDEETAEEAAGSVLKELALALARWPAGWWYSERGETVEALVEDVVAMCVGEAARGVGARVAWGVESERRRADSVRSRKDSLGGSWSTSMSASGGSERRGREETRERSRSRSPFGGTGMKHVRRASEGSPSPSPSPAHAPKPWPSKESPYKPRARSPLGASSVLGPAIVIRPKSKAASGAGQDQDQDQGQRGKVEGTTETWSPTTPPPTPPLSFSHSEGSLWSSPSGRRSPPPPPPPRSAKRPSSPTQSLGSSFATLDSSSTDSSPSSSALLKRSVHRRADSLPGGWPGPTSDDIRAVLEDRPGSPTKSEENDNFWDPAQRSTGMGARARPLSWASSGMVLGAPLSESSSLAGSRKSSAESLRGAAAGVHTWSSPSSSPSTSIRRPRARTQSDVQIRESLLAEVLQSALGFGAAVAAGAGAGAGVGAGAGSSAPARSGSPLRLDTSPSSSSQSSNASDRPLALSHHRRHSSLGLAHALEMELSPVREAEQEEEAKAERESSEESGGSVESVDAGAVDTEREGAGAESVVGDAQSVSAVAQEIVAEPVNSEEILPECSVEVDVRSSTPEGKSTVPLPSPEESLQADSQLGDQTTALPISGTSTPRSERQRSRSGTLASIPEEDWADWSIVEAPSVSEYDVDAAVEAPPSLTGDDSEVRIPPPSDIGSNVLLESEIPLPPSPPLSPVEADHQEHEDTLGGSDQERELDVQVVTAVPEITLTVEGPSKDVRGEAEVKTEDSQNVTRSPSETSGESSTASGASPSPLSDSQRFRLPLLRSPLLEKTRSTLSTFLVQPISKFFRSTSMSSGVSPVFEDTDSTDSLLRVSPLFSLLRLPFFRNLKQRRPSSASKPASLILSPPLAWNSPILDSEVDGRDRADESYSAARTGSWAMSCFVCGIMATLALAALQQRRGEGHMMLVNRFH